MSDVKIVLILAMIVLILYFIASPLVRFLYQ